MCQTQVQNEYLQPVILTNNHYPFKNTNIKNYFKHTHVEIIKIGQEINIVKLAFIQRKVFAARQTFAGSATWYTSFQKKF